MKKIILYIGSAVFAALMVYNIGKSSLIAKNTDVSLESIKIMAVSAQNELPPGYILLMQWAMIESGYWDGPYWREPIYDCVDADDKCLNMNT